MFCHACGNKFYENAKFCNKCGTPRLVATMTCPQNLDFIGIWELVATNEANLAALLAKDKTVVTRYFDDGSALMQVVDKSIITNGEGNLYHEQIFAWENPVNTQTLLASKENEDGSIERESATFIVKDNTLTLHGENYYTTEQRLADDFEITLLEEDGESGSGVAGKVVGGFLRGIVKGILSDE